MTKVFPRPVASNAASGGVFWTGWTGGGGADTKGESWLLEIVRELDEGEELEQLIPKYIDRVPGLTPKAVKLLVSSWNQTRQSMGETLTVLSTNRGLAGNGVRHWTREFANRRDPLAPTWSTVSAVLPEDATEEDRDYLARELLREMEADEDTGIPGWLPPMPEDGNPEPWNEAFAEKLRSLGADEAAKAWLIKAKATDEEHQEEPGKVWSRWVDWWGEGGWPFLEWLAEEVWKARPRGEGLKRPRVVVVAGQQHIQTPKPMAAMSWAIDGPAAEVVDGDKYAAAPGANAPALYLPRTHEMIPEWIAQQPGQRQLPFEAFQPAEPAAVALSGLTSSRELMSPVGGKLAVLLSCGYSGRASVHEWSKLLNPGVKRVRTADHKRTARAFHDLQDLRVYLPEGSCFRVFDMRWPYDPDNCDPDLVVGGRRGPMFEEFVGKHLRDWRRSESGSFIINLDGFLRLDNRQSALQRYYLRSAAIWNTARDRNTTEFQPAAVPPVTLESFAVLCNSLPPSAADYMRDKTGNRKQLHKAKLKVKDSLESLEGDKLIRLERPGGNSRDKLLILPPDTLLEAHRKFRQGTRKGKKKKS